MINNVNILSLVIFLYTYTEVQSYCTYCFIQFIWHTIALTVSNFVTYSSRVWTLIFAIHCYYSTNHLPFQGLPLSVMPTSYLNCSGLNHGLFHDSSLSQPTSIHFCNFTSKKSIMYTLPTLLNQTNFYFSFSSRQQKAPLFCFITPTIG